MARRASCRASRPRDLGRADDHCYHSHSHGRVAELADAQDSGSCVLYGTWGFNSPLAHHREPHRHGSDGSFDQISVSPRTACLKYIERNVPSYTYPFFAATRFDPSFAGLM
jgi:hypothetical protein